MDIGHECVVTMDDADTNDNMFTIVHDCVVTLHDAYTNDNMTTSTDFNIVHCLGVSAHCLVLSCLYIVTRTRTVTQVTSLCHSSHPCSCERFSSPCSPFFPFPHFLPHSFHFLLHLKFVENPRTPPKESMDLSDEFLLPTQSAQGRHFWSDTENSLMTLGLRPRRPCAQRIGRTAG